MSVLHYLMMLVQPIGLLGGRFYTKMLDYGDSSWMYIDDAPALVAYHFLLNV
jgi:hypothetical protein